MSFRGYMAPLTQKQTTVNASKTTIEKYITSIIKSEFKGRFGNCMSKFMISILC